MFGPLFPDRLQAHLRSLWVISYFQGGIPLHLDRWIQVAFV